MSSTPTHYHTEVCMDAWLNCENLLISLFGKSVSYSSRTLSVLDQCTEICLTTLHSLRTAGPVHQELALLCVGICEECAEVCERYGDTKFQTCAAICRRCSAAFAQLVNVE